MQALPFRRAGGTSLDSVLGPSTGTTGTTGGGGSVEREFSAPRVRRSAPGGDSFSAYREGHFSLANRRNTTLGLPSYGSGNGNSNGNGNGNGGAEATTLDLVAATSGGGRQGDSARRPAPSRPRPKTAPLETHLKFFNSPEAPPEPRGNAAQPPGSQTMGPPPERLVSPDSVFDLGDFESAPK